MQWPGVSSAVISSAPLVSEQRHAVPFRELLDADDVIAVAVRAEHVRDRDAVAPDAAFELVGQAVAVHEEPVTARPFRDEVPQLVDRWLAGELDVDPFLSHTLTLDDVNRGFELMHAQDGIRSVISFS